MAGSNCVFCKILVGKHPAAKVWESEKLLAFLDSRPVHPGHTLLIPKLHVDYIFDVQEPLYIDLFEGAKFLAEPIKKFAGTPRVGFAVEGFGVPHAHLHIIPIEHGGELLPYRQTEITTSAEELLRTAEEVKKYLQNS